MSDRVVKLIGTILKDVILVAMAVLVVLAARFVLKSQNGYKAGELAEVYLESDQDVVVESNMFSLLFDGPGQERALLFYPGDDIEEKAYAPLMYDLAKNGVDCVVAKMPFHRTGLDLFSGSVLISEYGYDYWFVSGHGEGAAKAAEVAAKREDKVCGLICLAGFTKDDMTESELPLLVIHGTLDDLWPAALFQKNAPNGATELPIVGGNFSQFGDFGMHAGDNMAAITEGDQRTQTVDAILTFVRANSPEPEEEYPGLVAPQGN